MPSSLFLKRFCSSKISEELDIELEQCKQIFTEAYLKYKDCKGNPDVLDSKLFQHISRLEDDLDFDYCFDNFSCLCRFCCKVTTGDADARHIFDDSTDDQLTESNELIDKIQFILYDNVSESKLSV